MDVNLNNCNGMLKYRILNYPYEAEWTPFQTHYFSENLVAPGIKPGTSGSVARNSDHWTTKAVDLYSVPALYASSQCLKN
jgi:hypothetical protein